MRAVIATYGTMGDIQPLLGLADEFRRRGHAVKFGAPPTFAHRVKGLGFDFVPLGPLIDQSEFREIYGRAFLSSDPVQHVRRTLPLAIRDAPQMVSELARACEGADRERYVNYRGFDGPADLIVSFR
jgi:UDP:flavonoid glycosyltransferase YjiC (YdhE family)